MKTSAEINREQEQYVFDTAARHVMQQGVPSHAPGDADRCLYRLELGDGRVLGCAAAPFIRHYQPAMDDIDGAGGSWQTIVRNFDHAHFDPIAVAQAGTVQGVQQCHDNAGGSPDVMSGRTPFLDRFRELMCAYAEKQGLSTSVFSSHHTYHRRHVYGGAKSPLRMYLRGQLVELRVVVERADHSVGLAEGVYIDSLRDVESGREWTWQELEALLDTPEEANMIAEADRMLYDGLWSYTYEWQPEEEGWR